jgi:N-acetylneuraminate synthase
MGQGTIQIRDRIIGDDQPTYIIAEIGINHNGSLEIAKKLIDSAASSNCDAVKFQKRTPHLCVPAHQQGVMKRTPWGTMTYLEYRDRVEFNEAEYREINRYCKEKGIMWFASCWDEPSIDFLEQFSPVCHKVCSAALTNDNLLRRLNATGCPIILSTGMSTMKEIRHAVSLLDQDRLLIAHCTSSYACQPEELNLNMIKTLRREFNCPIGYSGHEMGLVTTGAAVAIGASFVERHITLDRGMWGNDQKASLEPGDLKQLVRDIREIGEALGDGMKQVYASEEAALVKLRKIS